MNFYLFTVYIHMLAAFIWLGGMLFLALVLAPVSRKIDPPSLRGNLLKVIGARFRIVGWICIVTLIITGFLNIFNRGMTHEIFLPEQIFGTEFGRTLLLKLIVVTLMIILSTIHDFFVGPRMTALLQNSKTGEQNSELQKMRWQVSWLARLNTVFAVLVIFFAAKLAR